MQTTARLACFFIVSLSALLTNLQSAQETTKPAPPHPDVLVLADGRSFKQWKIMSETATTLTISSDRVLVKIAKSALSEPMRSAYPLDPDKVADEQIRLEAEKAEAAERAAESKARAEARSHDERERWAEAAKKESADVERRAIERAASRDGLLLVGLRTAPGAAVVAMKNITDSTQTFDWHQLHGRSAQGDPREPGAIMARDPKYGYAIEAGETRVFQIVFGARTMHDTNGLAEVCWVDGIWLKNADEQTSVKAMEAKAAGR